MQMTKEYLLTWLILNNTLLCCVCEYGSFDDMDRLHKNLTKNYNRNIRPVRNQSDVVVVDIEVHIVSIQGLDEKAQVFSSTIGLLTYWTDENLRWDPQDYGGAELLTFQLKDIWVPDISLQNAVDNGWAQFQADPSSRVTVNSSGRVSWYTGGNVQTTCTINIQKYPFDQQTCPIIIGKMYSLDWSVMLNAISETISQNLFKGNGEYDIVSSRTYNIVLWGYTRLAHELILKRKPFIYIMNVILPVLVLSFLNILTFKLPAGCGERIGYCMSLLLTFTVLLNTVSNSMPKISENISYLHMFVYLQLTMSSVITFISVYMVNVCNCQGDARSLPVFLKLILILKKINCRRADSVDIAEAVDNGSEDKKEPDQIKTSQNEEMNCMAIAMKTDIVLFWIFLILFMITSASTLYIIAM